jgi:GTP-binding protein
MHFIDEAKIYLKAGDGGAGSVSFRREKFIEYGGPDGGHGGKGADIIFQVVDGLNTLIDFRYKQHFKAQIGMHGMGRNRSGKAGDDMVINVPLGTQVYDESANTLLADLSTPGQSLVIAHGGRGGAGNAAFKSSTNQAPYRAKPGVEGEEAWVWLKLKLLSDIGLVGLPNAGKSTMLGAMTAASPKIGDYPFTTLRPQLGVAYHKDKEIVIADIPGLIEGASQGHGLGDKFLKHVERCKVILHIIDASGDVLNNYITIRTELKSYSASLEHKKELIVINKIDLVDEARLNQISMILHEYNADVKILPASGASRLGLDLILDQLISALED